MKTAHKCMEYIILNEIQLAEAHKNERISKQIVTFCWVVCCSCEITACIIFRMHNQGKLRKCRNKQAPDT